MPKTPNGPKGNRKNRRKTRPRRRGQKWAMTRSFYKAMEGSSFVDDGTIKVARILLVCLFFSAVLALQGGEIDRHAWPPPTEQDAQNSSRRITKNELNPEQKTEGFSAERWAVNAWRRYSLRHEMVMVQKKPESDSGNQANTHMTVTAILRCVCALSLFRYVVLQCIFQCAGLEWISERNDICAKIKVISV